MVKENIFDEATDILKVRMRDAFAEMRRQFKGTKPYRKESVDEEELMNEYTERILRGER